MAVLLGLLPALCLWPSRVEAQQCPPVVNSPSLQTLLDQCENWEGVVYDPSEGFLPEDHPEFPWNALYHQETTVELTDGKLVVTGPTTSGLIEFGSIYWREEAALLNPSNTLFLLQVRQRMTYISPDPVWNKYMGDGVLADNERISIYGLHYSNGQPVVTLGPGGLPANPL
jgi:hypothetical protein